MFLHLYKMINHYLNELQGGYFHILKLSLIFLCCNSNRQSMQRKITIAATPDAAPKMLCQDKNPLDIATAFLAA